MTGLSVCQAILLQSKRSAGYTELGLQMSSSERRSGN